MSDRLKELEEILIEALEDSQSQMRHRLTVLQTHAIRLADAMAEGTIDPEIHQLAATRVTEEQATIKRKLDQTARLNRPSVPEHADTLWNCTRGCHFPNRGSW